MLQKFAKIGAGTLGVLAVLIGVSGTANAATPHATSSLPARVSRTVESPARVPSARSLPLARVPHTGSIPNPFTGVCSDATVYAPSLGGYVNVGGTFYCNPGSDSGVTVWEFPNGALQVFVIGYDSAQDVWSIWSNPGENIWYGWKSMGGNATSFVLMGGGGNTPSINVLGSDEDTWYHRTRSDSGSWGGWKPGLIGLG